MDIAVACHELRRVMHASGQVTGTMRRRKNVTLRFAR